MASIFEEFKTEKPKLSKLDTNPVAYFCAEFALTDELPIYSGGLGILAGDVVREASDMELPFVAVGLLYKQGYFKQVISGNGMQDELPAYHSSESLPVTKLHNAQYEPLTVSIHLGDREVLVQLWEYKQGNVRVILLDTDIQENSESDKRLTLSLYPADSDWRIQQEIILGIGGVRALHELNISPSIYHMNEGHSAFAVLEIAHQYMKKTNAVFDEAFRAACKATVFTNHTLIPSGNDIFHKDQVERILGSYAKHLGLPTEKMIKFGEISGSPDFFSMTHLALSTSKKISAVSRSHAQFAKVSWPNFELKPITNGVHRLTWQSHLFHELGEKVERGFEVSDGSIWRAHLDAKEKLTDYVIAQTGKDWNPEVLTITWSRRIAAYKQPLLIFEDMERLSKIVNNPRFPVQIILSGKAHPGDTTAKKMISEIITRINENEFGKSIIFLPNYSMEMAKVLVSGSDVWLNTPQKGMEACGTSGMKAGLNGVLQAAISDGWTDEIDLADIGFFIHPTESAISFYETMEKQIVPCFYEGRDISGTPLAWVEKMRKTIAAVENRFTSRRMLLEYITELYLPVLE